MEANIVTIRKINTDKITKDCRMRLNLQQILLVWYPDVLILLLFVIIGNKDQWHGTHISCELIAPLLKWVGVNEF